MTAVDLSPARLDLTIVAGDSFAESVTFSQSGAALNLSSYSHRAQVRSERSGSANLLATMTVGTASAATGVIAFSLTATQTAALDPGRYCWEYEWTVGSTVRTMLGGEFVVAPQVARP
jgi:hypothetical protein